MPGERLSNLPAPRTRLIGREAELAAVRELTQRAEGRLVTLVGAGGSGKTSLALEAARGLLPELPDGAWLVELAPLVDPALVFEAVASALGVQAGPGRLLSEALATFVGDRAPLLLLDNCEHLIEACAELADGLLVRCPALRVLATSREPLRVGGEVSWRVPPLASPDPWRSPSPDELTGYAAVQLFVE